jgi:replicative DNA helicase
MPISTSLQENVLSLLCFSPEHVDLIASNINVDMFDNEIYREIAEKAIRHHKRYKKAIRGHLPDVFEKQLDKSKNKKKADIYEAVIKGIHDLYREVDPEFVMTQLKKFVHEQTTRLTLKKAVELFQEGKMDAVDRVLRERDRTRLDTFDPGLRFSRDMPRTLAFLRHQDELFTSGIPYLDTLGVVPVRKELFTMVGLPGTGKSMGLVHIGKFNILAMETVVHITLEMSEERSAQRYVQAILAIAKRSYEMRNMDLTLDNYGRVIEMKLDKLPGIWSLRDDNIATKIERKLNRLMTPRLIIKEFPTGQLTIDMLEAYLENLQANLRIRPSILIVDYADLMNIDAKNMRIETGKIYQMLRGLAIQYNMAVVTASQANRAGQDVTTLTRKHLAEDFSKVAISDNVVTYNQTGPESTGTDSIR